MEEEKNEKVEYLEHEDVQTMEKKIQKLREEEAQRERERITSLKIEEKTGTGTTPVSEISQIAPEEEKISPYTQKKSVIKKILIRILFLIFILGIAGIVYWFLIK